MKARHKIGVRILMWVAMWLLRDVPDPEDRAHSLRSIVTSLNLLTDEAT